MGYAIPTDPRIVCVDCRDVVDVHFLEHNIVSDEVYVGLDCCTRRFGTIHGDKFKRLDRDGRKLTTNDVRPLDPARVAERALENIEQDTKRLNWARWAMSKENDGK